MRMTGENVRRTIAGMAVVMLAGVLGCAAQSEMTDLWKDPSFGSAPVRNVLVVGVRKDPVRRRIWEDAFATELRARGVTVTSSYTLTPDAVPDTQQVIDAIRQNGYDAVLVSIRQPSEATSRYVSGAVRQELVPRGTFGPRGTFARYRSYWVTIQEPGYTETDTIVRVQTDVWATRDEGRLVWSGTLEALESVSGTVADVVGKKIVPELEKHGIVPRKP